MSANEITPKDIKPYQTILIMKKKCAEQLEFDCAPRFKKFIENHDPSNDYNCRLSYVREFSS